MSADGCRQVNLGLEMLEAMNFIYHEPIYKPAVFEPGAWVLKDGHKAYRVLAIGLNDYDDIVYYALLHQTKYVIKVIAEGDLTSCPRFDVGCELQVLAEGFVVDASVTSREYSYQDGEWSYELSGREDWISEPDLEEILLQEGCD